MAVLVIRGRNHPTSTRLRRSLPTATLTEFDFATLYPFDVVLDGTDMLVSLNDGFDQVTLRFTPGDFGFYPGDNVAVGERVGGGSYLYLM